MEKLIESVISGLKKLEKDEQESKDRLDFYRIATRYGFFNLSLLEREGKNSWERQMEVGSFK